MSFAQVTAGSDGMSESQSKLSPSTVPLDECTLKVACGNGCANSPSRRVTWSTAGDSDCEQQTTGIADDGDGSANN